MKQELRDSIVHTLATMILDNADNPNFQQKCRMTIQTILALYGSSAVHRDLSRCLIHATNCDDVDGINALISAVRMNGRQ